MTDANYEGFPVCDDRITENDWCVIRIIGIHCQFPLPKSISQKGIKNSQFAADSWSENLKYENWMCNAQIRKTRSEEG